MTELWQRNGVLVRLKWEEIPERYLGEEELGVGMVWDCGRPEDGEALLSLASGELEKWGYPSWGESMGMLCFDVGGMMELRVKEMVHVIFGVEKQSWLIPERYLEVIDGR